MGTLSSRVQGRAGAAVCHLPANAPGVALPSIFPLPGLSASPSPSPGSQCLAPAAVLPVLPLALSGTCEHLPQWRLRAGSAAFIANVQNVARHRVGA